MRAQILHDKIVLITGASSGIGEETAKQFAVLGATVLLLARNEERLRRVAESIRSAGGKAEVFSLDLADLKAVVAVAERIKTRIGVPDILINNAGAGKWRFIEETDYKDAVDMIFVPYLASFFFTKAFMAEMLKRDSEHIVNATSFAAKIPFFGATSYIASRKAMIGLHEALTADLHGTNLRTSLSYFAKANSPLCEHNLGRGTSAVGAKINSGHFSRESCPGHSEGSFAKQKGNIQPLHSQGHTFPDAFNALHHQLYHEQNRI